MNTSSFRFNWYIFGIPLFLSVLGISSMFSLKAFDIAYNQILFVVIGCILAFILSKIDIKLIINYAPILFVVVLIITAGTLIFGVTRNATTAWYQFFGFTFQPSEILKVVYILALARYFLNNTYHTTVHVIKSLCIYTLPVLLVLYLQRDMGTAFVFMFSWFCMILSISFSMIEKKRLITLFISGALILGILAVFLLQNYQTERLAVFPDHLLLRLNHHPDMGYQVDQSLIAIGSTSFFGKGLGNGTQTINEFLPEPHNDFIFPSIVESMGISSAILILCCYAFLLYKIYMITVKCQQIYTDVVIAGVLGIFFFHIFQNIGMTIGLMPVTGISLPFMSSGGSFTILSFLLVGLCQGLLLQYKKHSL